jgi:tetratricopeptide (TPR) repeat protein
MKYPFLSSRSLLAIVFAVLCAFWAAPSPSSGQEDSATEAHLADVFSRAQAAQQQKDYRTAALCYEEIVKLRPDVAEAWANLGLMHQFMDEYPQADHNFQIALNKNPRLFVPNLFLGLNQLRAKQPALALRYLKTAESLNPNDEQAAMGLAHAYQALKDNTAASKWFAHATGINAADPEAWYGLGIAYLSLQDAAVVQLARLGQTGPYARALVADSFVLQGRAGDAINIYNQLLPLPSQPPCLETALGFAYLQQDSERALETFHASLEKHPECLNARLGLARLALQKGNFAEILNQAHSAWNSDQNFVRANAELIWKDADPNQITKAAAWLSQNASAQDAMAHFLVESSGAAPSDSLAASGAQGQQDHESPASQAETPEGFWAQGHYTACAAKLQREKTVVSFAKALLLAQCAYYSGNYRASLTASESALGINPQGAPALYWKAKSSQELAADALERMNAASPGSPKVHLLLAELHRAREEFGAAEAEYNQVIIASPNDPAAHLGLAQVYYQQSQDDKVLAEVQPVLKSDPANSQGSLLMGEVLVRRHQFSEAVPYLQTARNGPPLSQPQVHSLLARCFAAQGNYSGALAELKPALASDSSGIFYYQLYQIYQKLGDTKAAAAALQESQKRRREESEAEVRQKAASSAEPAP